MMKKFLLMMVLACGLASCATSPQQEVRRIGLNWSDSRCIGNPVTPLCAVETWLACFSRKQDALCEMVAPGILKLIGAAEKPFLLEYEIVRNHRITSKNLSKELTDLFGDIAPGYHMMMTTLKACAVHKKVCGEEAKWMDFTGYSLKKVGKKWMFADSYSRGALM